MSCQWGGWKFAFKELGDHCVAIDGLDKMLQWFVSNLDLLLQVRLVPLIGAELLYFLCIVSLSNLPCVHFHVIIMG